MSPTPMPPSEASIREAERFRRSLLETGFAAVDQIVGCTDEEISRVAAVASFPLPDDYLAFLKVLGRKAGPLFEGTEIYFPEPLDAIETAEDIAEGSGENLTLDNRFFLGHHQGYRVFFFEKGSPAVYGYQEGYPEVQKLAESFQAWLWEVLERTRSIQERIRQRDAKTEAIQAQMRAEGKL